MDSSNRGRCLDPSQLGRYECPSVGPSILWRFFPVYVYGYLPWHGHVLPRTPVIQIMCVNQIYLQG